MSPHHRTSASATTETSARRREAVRLGAILLSIIALLLTSSALNLVSPARADGAPLKAVVVAGPVHSRTVAYRGYCKAIADAAEMQGMDVIRIFHPYAPASKVKAQAQGAHLFVYCGHGNGWPSAYGPFQEKTKNGLGLDAANPAQRSPNTVVYKGADWLRDNVALAADAVVILSHLSYASGNASSGMTIPTREVAVKRVDNFANGFLSIGARVVFALGWQPGADIVNALYDEDKTMDAVFKTRYREPASPLNGWIGWKPGYYPSVRVPGATVHIDPDPDEGFLRGLTGDMSFTTTAWRGSDTGPADTVAPVVGGLKADQEAVTIAAAGVPVFTPNGDGLSDRIRVGYTLSEPAHLEVKVKRDGKLIRRYTKWAYQGPGNVYWNGRKDDGALAAEGKYNIYLTPTDGAGNVGTAKSVQAKLLNSVRNPSVSPALFWGRDGDALVPTAVLRARLTRQATVSWVIRDSNGKVVRVGIDNQVRKPGMVVFAWNGRTDGGGWAPDGRYTARIRVTRVTGTYAHEVTLRHMPFMAWTPSWIRTRGDTVTLKLTSAEPLTGKPVVTANQTGIAKYTVPASRITRLSATSFKVVVKTRAAGKAGPMYVRVVGTDRNGGTNTKVFTLTLK